MKNVITGWVLISLPVIKSLAQAILGDSANEAFKSLEANLPQVLDALSVIVALIGAKFLSDAQPKVK